MPTMPLLLFHVVLLAAVSLAACSGELGHRRPHAHTHQNDPSLCHKSLPCGGHVDVHYPFFLANAALAVVDDGGDGHPARSYCGYPGMAVTCDGGCAILRLGGHNYTILDISYENHTVVLVDRDLLINSGECPRLTHNVTVPAPPKTSKSPLNLHTNQHLYCFSSLASNPASVTAANNKDLSFFYDCVFTADTAAPAQLPDIPPINCSSFPGGRGVSFVARQSDMERQEQDAEWPRACRTVVVAPVLKDSLRSAEHHPQLNGDWYGQVLKRGFQLSWEPSAGPCYVCEQTKGKCSYNHSGVFVGCLRSDGSVRNSDCGKHGLYLEHAYFS
ncbi:hypothetical protein PVAP13_3KG281800 [Panicum virgatum]|uniref:Wall-associated receptor kinase galacturonan-binding domain-containing protein n=1 Tax=Panicum virgatum TaxID=38727 RepID=A0A8T0UPE4_PANVG|nr:hypothetical protein PVAP13_3KG281800 [Panicum virgatum]